LEAIWRDCLGEALQIRRFDLIVPISKKHLVAMDPRKPRIAVRLKELLSTSR
jgi:hypothetical protein